MTPAQARHHGLSVLLEAMFEANLGDSRAADVIRQQLGEAEEALDNRTGRSIMRQPRNLHATAQYQYEVRRPARR